MHSKTYGDYYVHHNGDYSGDIEITKRDAGGAAHPVCKLPFWLLAEIVAGKIHQDRMEAMANTHPTDLLKTLWPRRAPSATEETK